ncbi:MarR family winged helix-turn-helix transcriptional regulator [Psychromicrobium lacuslunae]|nr:MarR family transcriptional regulator [Psychromicrobium lacuslunae]
MADLGHLLHDIVMHMDRDADARLSPLGLTLRRFVAMTVIAEHPGITSRQLAAPLGISEPAVSQALKPLAARELIYDASPQGSGRSINWQLSSEGERLFSEARDRLGNDFDDLVRRTGLNPDLLAGQLQSILNELKKPIGEK